jgi:hypothetical protein
MGVELPTLILPHNIDITFRKVSFEVDGSPSAGALLVGAIGYGSVGRNFGPYYAETQLGQ